VRGAEDVEVIETLGGHPMYFAREEEILALERGLITGFIDENGLLITETPQGVSAPTPAPTPIE
jgi:hypothetical protein